MVDEHRPTAGPPPGIPEHPEVRHERSDASFGWILGLLIGGIVLAALIHFVLLRCLRDYENYQATIKRSAFPLAATPREGLPAEPRLEQLDRLAQVETLNVYVRQASKEEQLHRYGPTPEEGFIHVPIERAMTFLGEQNKFPVRKGAPPGDPRRENGLLDAGDSNSGRLFRGKP